EQFPPLPPPPGGGLVGGRLPPPPPPPPPPPEPPRKMRVKSRALPPRPEQLGETPPPAHGWSRPTDQNARRPTPLELAKLTMLCAAFWSTVSPPLSLLPIIGVMPMPPKPDTRPAVRAAFSVPCAADLAAAAMSATGWP